MRLSTTVLAAVVCLAATSLSPVATGFDQLTLHASPSDPKSRRLIQTSHEGAPEWMTERQVEMLMQHRIRFMDITETYKDGQQLVPPFRTALPSSLSKHKQVEQYLQTMNTDLMKRTLEKFTSFHTRYYKSKSGSDSQRFLYGRVQDIAHRAKRHGDGQANVTVKLFKHSWPQSSIIARFEGSKYPDEVVVIGAHQDSVNMWIPAFGRAPGADDDGSGTVTTLEAFRALVEGNFRPERSVEFHWYSAEEAGLLGSQDVASAYNREGRKIVAMLQNDMTGFRPDPEVIGVVTDFVDGELTGFLKQLIAAYSGVQWSEMKCGYACSDHASWNKYGFRSAFHFETDDLQANPNVHTTGDRLETIDFNHALRYAKVSVGFAVELSSKSE
ncbi:hypothetical protein SYNPS1DRAFT_13147 [Syncephalis pseudoplumigaleata]|uniref:Peptide hydrolase n=1 Tax=Syncephalis pseudoplumigaleata TaxID=1712513 RepID=A0A4P9Z408_9FUNG|nr:hypothetical protein SYNPS1DRAFT_13147 [Syncephalis pseudoplumigaleata]|eukprot:RKP27138.1 hypothetical protein SYNPS1DRAFT_13147 [Syncephalis pseudoplumigaleata]